MTAPIGHPATILSPYGEGYCRTCRFIIGLGPEGRLDKHDRYGKSCTGSFAKPPKLIPYRSRKSAFTTVPVKRKCSRCGQDAPLLADGRYAPHPAPLLPLCLGSYTYPPAPERDHSSERG